MPTTAFAKRRSRLETYFDHTALEAWTQLTSDAPVGKIRATVRAGRERMHGLLLGWLPTDLTGKTLLDAGCGTGTLAIEMARRGGTIIAIDIAANLIDIARRRTPADLAGGSIDYRVGDMLEPGCATLDHVVAMDSLIHYETKDTVAILARLARQTRYSILITVAPRTPSLTLMHAVGRIFPRGNRAPAIMPADMAALSRQIENDPGLKDWRIGRSERVNCGFYTSQAIELVRR